jgi:hypothetical protein
MAVVEASVTSASVAVGCGWASKAARVKLALHSLRAAVSVSR